jgi:DNA cross-link repair 1A protein
MSQFLEIELNEEEGILSNSQIQPRPDVIMSDITDLQNQIDPSRIFEELMSKIYDTHDEAKKRINLEKSLVAVESDDDDENQEKSKKKKPIAPKYKIIEGSTFAVDAFRYGEISHVEHYFLTHFHADHYIGLRKKFCYGTIYLSKITATLVKAFIGIADKYLKVVHVNVPFYIEDVRIVPLDANHCPGALLFLFQFPDGRHVLHTGDFRANDEMVKQLIDFDSASLDLIYLDTTYLQSKKIMPSQEESISYLLEHVQKFLESNIGEKFLILVGSYLVGKEKIWMAIAEKFNFKVFLEKERFKAFKEICGCSVEYFNFFKNHITLDEEEADVRVVSMLQITYPNLRDFLSEHQDSYNTILGVMASGWEPQRFSSGRVSILSVQYSEHSSYAELENFVLKTKPKSVISTVPVRMDPASTPDIPQNWLTDDNKSRKKKKQKKLSLKKS